MGRDAGILFQLMKLILARTTEVGGRTLFNAAIQGAEAHGKYMSDCKIEEPAGLVKSKESKELQDRIWKELVTKLEAIHPGILDLI